MPPCARGSDRACACIQARRNEEKLDKVAKQLQAQAAKVAAEREAEREAAARRLEGATSKARQQLDEERSKYGKQRDDGAPRDAMNAPTHAGGGRGW